jgi:hypothetical protein
LPLFGAYEQGASVTPLCSVKVSRFVIDAEVASEQSLWASELTRYERIYNDVRQHFQNLLRKVVFQGSLYFWEWKTGIDVINFWEKTDIFWG